MPARAVNARRAPPPSKKITATGTSDDFGQPDGGDAYGGEEEDADVFGGQQGGIMDSGSELDPVHLSALQHIVTDAPSKGIRKAQIGGKRQSISMADVKGINEYTFVRHYQSHAENFVRWMLIVSRGVSGKVKILHYDLQALVRSGGLATAHLDGTLFTMDNCSLMFMMALGSAFAIVFIIVHGMLADGKSVETAPLIQMAKTMNQVVPFVLGLYVTLALNRWWTIRVHGLQELFNAIGNLYMVVACVMHPERHRPVRTLIMKWSFASIFLLLKAVRNKGNLNDMYYKGLLSEAEIKVLEPIQDLYGRPAILWGWVLRLTHESFGEAVGPMPYSIQCAKVAEICMSASSGLSVIEMHLNTALPFVYVHLITLLVDINNLVFLMKTAVVAAVAYHEADWKRFASELVFCIMVPTLYRGLLSISYAIFDPFGDDVLDFPVGSIMDWNASCCYAVLRAQELFPGVPESVYAASQNRLSAMGVKPSDADPVRFEATRNKFRRVLFNAHRSGRLEQVCRQMQRVMKEQERMDSQKAPQISNAKSSAAILAATKFAEPVAAELRQFGKSMRDGLIRLRHDVHELHRTVDKSGFHQRMEVQRAVEMCGGTLEPPPPALDDASGQFIPMGDLEQELQQMRDQLAGFLTLSEQEIGGVFS